MKSKFRRRCSKAIRLSLIGTPLFFAGCYSGYQDNVVVEHRVADRVEVVTYAQPGYNYSPYYGGYVPAYVPIWGFTGPGYYSGGYRPSRTVVNNYITTHRPTVIRPSAARTTTVTTTRPWSTTTTRNTVPAAPPRSAPTPSYSSSVSRPAPVSTGGFGSTGRTSFGGGGGGSSVSTSSSAGS